MPNPCQKVRFDVFKFRLPDLFVGETWDGFRWKLGEVSAGTTEFNGTLERVRFQFQNELGQVVMDFDSDPGEEVYGLTIVEDAPNLWEFVIEPMVLPLVEGTYKWGFETIEADTLRTKVRMAGTIKVRKDPVV
jgi:hypothetical protein